MAEPVQATVCVSGVRIPVLRAMHMKSLRNNRWARAIVLLFIGLWPVSRVGAQTFQFVPEIDAYSRLSQQIRFNFQVKETREAGDPTQAEIGPGFDFFVKPLVRLKDIGIFDPDEAKSRMLQLSVGFRYVPSYDKPHVERLEVAFTSNFPLVAKILLSDRNRADLDWSQGQLNWRYRNRAKFQRTFTIGSYHPAPYLSAEFFYQSQYAKWSTTALYAGCLFPVRRRYSFDAYYEHQNITGKRPNRQLNQLGLVLNIYF